MKNQYDAGTPELQAKRAQKDAWLAGEVKQADKSKAGGLEFLYATGTLNFEQRHKGSDYARWCASYHSKHNIRCSLGNLAISEGAQEPASEYQEWQASIMDNAQWFSEVSGRLTEISTKAKRPYAKIVLMVSVYGWNLRDVAKHGGLYRQKENGKPIASDTAKAWTTQAFDKLIAVIAEIENEHKRKKQSSAGMT